MAERTTRDQINDLMRDNTEGFEAHAPRGPIRGSTAAYVNIAVRTLCQPFSAAR